MSQVTSLLLPLAELLFSLARLLLPLTAFLNMLTASQAVIVSRISIEKKNRFPPRHQAAFERISTIQLVHFHCQQSKFKRQSKKILCERAHAFGSLTRFDSKYSFIYQRQSSDQFMVSACLPPCSFPNSMNKPEIIQIDQSQEIQNKNQEQFTQNEKDVFKGLEKVLIISNEHSSAPACQESQLKNPKRQNPAITQELVNQMKQKPLTLFCTRIPLESTYEQLKEAFEAFGQVSKLFLQPNNRYAHVQYVSSQCAEKALAAKIRVNSELLKVKKAN